MYLFNWFGWPYKRGKIVKDSAHRFGFYNVAVGRINGLLHKKIYGRFAGTKKN